MSKIESVKTYTGRDLENIFFRPIMSGDSAESIGIRMLYNMPVPTTLHFWQRSADILQKYSSTGWNGSNSAERFQKTIEMQKVKAEVGYSASDYFSMVYELISGRADVNFDDLSGTELEQAETTLFKEAIAESIRATMWLGNTARATEFNTFDGFVKRICDDKDDAANPIKNFSYGSVDSSNVENVLYTLWASSSPLLRELKAEGQLAFFVTSDIYLAYEDFLEQPALDSAYMARRDGTATLTYRGIPIVDICVDRYMPSISDLPKSFALLTDRRNLAMAVNTSDFPGTEARMWYNPDLMENRQRVIFMAGCDYLLPELISFAYAL